MTTDDPSTTTAETTKKTEIKWSAKYDDDDADVELVSSDGWHFKVHSYRLQTISPVFRSMISMATADTQRDPITFTDDEIETGLVIRMFLDTVYTDIVENLGEMHANNKRLIMNLIEFAQKWQCLGMLKMIERTICGQLQSKSHFDKYDLFLYAMAMENYELAGNCLGSHHETRWDGQAVGLDWTNSTHKSISRSPAEVFQGLPTMERADVFDILAIPYGNFLNIDQDTLWVLLRSSHLAKANKNGKRFQENLADEFVKIMKLAHPHAFDDPKSVPRKRASDEI